MATSPGQRFVRRHNAARSSTSNTTAADISYDTAVLSEGGYSWSSPEVTVDEAGLYLCMFDIGEVQIASTRAVGTLLPSVNATDQTFYKARSRYLRNSGGLHGVSFGNCILDLAVNDDVKIRNPGAVTGSDALGNYATNVNQGGGFQLIRLPDGNFTEVQRQSNLGISISFANATRPWIDSTGTWTQITFTNEIVDDDALYPGTGGDLTLAANTKYLIVYGATFDGSSSQRQTHHLRLDIDGTNVQHSTGYERNNASDGPPMQGMYLHETGVSSEVLRLYGTTEQEDAGVSNTVNCANAYLQIIELPSSAEWIHADNGATDSLDTAWAGTTTYYDTPLSSSFRADGGSDLSLDSANNAIQNDSGASLPVLAIGWHMTDRDNGTSGTRKHSWCYWDNGGTRAAYGISGGYNRGQQGNDDTHRLGYIGAATLDLANGADLSWVTRDPQSGANSNMGVYASTNRHYLGVQVLNLNTLASAGASHESDVPLTSLAYTLNAATSETTENQQSDVPALSATYSLLAPTSEVTDFQASDVPAESVGYTLFAPTSDVTESRTSDVPVETINYSLFAPSSIVTENQLSSVPVESITYSLLAPISDVAQGHQSDVPLISVSYSLLTPTSEVTENKVSILPLNNLTYQLLTPQSDVTENQRSDVPAEAITYSLLAPQSITEDSHQSAVPTESITYTLFAPTSQVATNHVSNVPVEQVSYSLLAPSSIVTENQLSQVPLVSLAYGTFAPNSLVSDLSDVPAISLSYTLFAPTSEVAEGHTSNVGVEAISYALFAPTGISTEHVASDIPLQSLGYSLLAPTSLVSENVFSDVPVESLGYSLLAPTSETQENHISILPAAAITYTLIPPLSDDGLGSPPATDSGQDHVAAFVCSTIR